MSIWNTGDRSNSGVPASELSQNYFSDTWRKLFERKGVVELQRRPRIL
jgi:hypothetical protein